MKRKTTKKWTQAMIDSKTGRFVGFIRTNTKGQLEYATKKVLKEGRLKKYGRPVET